MPPSLEARGAFVGALFVALLAGCTTRVQAEPPPAPEPAPVATVPAPVASTPWRPTGELGCPEVEPNRASLRFGTTTPLDCSRPNTCRTNKKLVGASAGEIFAYLGEPLRCEGERWTYRLNGDCRSEHDLLFLVVVDGIVESASHEHRFASQDCPPGEDHG